MLFRCSVYYFDFNPRSLAGATCSMSATSYIAALFQSTLPCGSDVGIDVPIMQRTDISIHAPLRERHSTKSFASSRSSFQSTLPCGSDAFSGLSRWQRYHFNPRSLAGATFLALAAFKTTSISIHAPLRERRGILYLAPLIVTISIHAPLRERL